MSSPPIASTRRDYPPDGLDPTEPDPLRLFDRWYTAAASARLLEPNAMALATVGRDGRPSVRTVLLKGYDARGLVFFTNYTSRKAAELETNPRAALLFWWAELALQVRIEGTCQRVSAEESDAYFATRPRGAQLGAWASPQSQVIPDRAVLERRLEELERQFAGRPVPRPPHWGGYRLTPDEFEFWKGRPNRLHDRLRYRPRGDGTWMVERLAP